MAAATVVVPAARSMQARSRTESLRAVEVVDQLTAPPTARGVMAALPMENMVRVVACNANWARPGVVVGVEAVLVALPSLIPRLEDLAVVG